MLFRPTLGTLVLAACTLPGLAVAAVPNFDAAASLATGLSFPDDLRPVDLDGDGDLDFIVAASSDNDVLVYLNTAGDASAFSAVLVDNNLTGAKDVVPADLDGDGDLDLLAAALSGNEIVWYSNDDGDATTWTRSSVAACAGAYAAVAADLDGDGDVDAASVCSSVDTVVWWANNGTGGVWGATTVATGFDAGSDLEAGDLDGDGDTDLVGAAFSDDELSWFENGGSGGTWSTIAIATAYNGPVGVHLADLDADGDLDVAATARTAGTLDWFENADGVGTSWTSASVDATLSNADSVTSVDLDEDGDLDLIAAGGGVTAWYANTAGSFTANAFSGAPASSLAAAVGDLDGDGDLDPMVVGSAASGTVSWFTNDTIHHGSTIETAQTVGALSGARAVALGDFDGDGDPDIAEGTSSGTVQWVANDGDGGTWSVTPIATGVGNVVELVAFDVDADGDLDLAGAALDVGDVLLWRNDGAGATWTTVVVSASFGGANAVSVADMDGDGDLDIVSAASSADDVAWFENSSGDGSTWVEETVDASLDGAADVAVGDLDADGDVDIASAALVGHEFKVFTLSQAGTNSSKTTVATGTLGANSVALGDIDGDGDLDLVGAAGTAGQILWWRNDGSAGTWTQYSVDGAFSGARAVVLEDFDRDGDLDVAAAGATAGEFAWWESNGAVVPGWTKHTVSTGGSLPHGLAVGDLNADGAADAVGSDATAGTVVWWTNDRAQAGWTGTDVASATPQAPSTTAAVLALGPVHLGRFGDNAAEVAELTFRLESVPGTALTTLQATSVFGDVQVHVDANANGIYDAGVDTFIASSGAPNLTAGQMTIALPDGNAAIDFGLVGPPTLLVVVETTATAGQALIPTVRVVHVPSAGVLEDDTHDTPLEVRQDDDVVAVVAIDQPPTADAGPAAGSYTVVEGGTLSMDGSLSVDAETSVVAWAWDCDDDGTYETTSVTAGGASCSGFVDDGVVGIGLEVTDATGLSATTTANVTVTNAPPTVVGLPGTTAAEGVTYGYAPSATDPGVVDTFTWSLATSPAGMTVDPGTGVVSWTPTFADVGPNTVVLEIVDDDGGTGDQSWSVEVSASDDDLDGMADGWELQFGLDPTVDDSALDGDGDGVSNLDEYLGGTDPTVFDGPGVPTPVSPVGGAVVATALPALEWTNATDPQGDSLTYDVEVYADASLTVLIESSTGISEDVSGATLFATTVPNAENSEPVWRVRAVDPFVAGTWSDAASFFVNTTNDAPDAPGLTTPIGGQSVGTLTPDLVWGEATDPDRDSMTYDVRLWDGAQTTVLAEATGITAIAGSAFWTVSITLAEDAVHAWQARAVDDGGLAGPWASPETFFVNTENQAPTAVNFTAPDDGSEVDAETPRLVCTESTDPEGERIEYRFELSTDAGFATVEASANVPHEGTGEVSWDPADDGVTLVDDVVWFARVRAEDELGAASDWDEVSFFLRGLNDAPAVPALVGPEDGSDAANASLVAAHVVDPEGDAVSYSFVLARDEALTDVVEQADGLDASAGPEGTADQTSWVPEAPFSGTVYWSARSEDDRGASSDWAPARSLRAGRAVVLAEAPTPESGCRAEVASGSTSWAVLLLVLARRRRVRARAARL